MYIYEVFSAQIYEFGQKNLVKKITNNWNFFKI